MALTAATLQALLTALGPDAGDAGERYERLRRRLILFFSARRIPDPDACADESLDRLAQRLTSDSIPNIEPFVLGIARNIAREQWKRPHAAATDPALLAAPAPSEDDTARCLDLCLDSLNPTVRSWLYRFYAGSGLARIAASKTLARELGIDSNALRVRLFRIRAKLEQCVNHCLDGNEPSRTTISVRE